MRKVASLVTLALICSSGSAALADGFGRISRDGNQSTYQPQNWTPTVAPNQSWQEQQARNAAMQRQALQAQRDAGYSPNGNGTGMADRWENEWRTQHPGQPMPNFGQLEKMHRGETLNNINNGFNAMRARRQQELSRNKSLAKQLYAKQIGKPGGTLSASEEQAFNRQYDNDQREYAEDFKRGQQQAGEIFEAERLERERRQWLRPDH